MFSLLQTNSRFLKCVLALQKKSYLYILISERGSYFFKRRVDKMDNDIIIFTITTIRHLMADMRSVGYTTNYYDAAIQVMENACDISEEGFYRYAVIEEVKPGIYTFPRKEYWFFWNKDTEAYSPCEKPEKFRQIVGFSLG